MQLTVVHNAVAAQNRAEATGGAGPEPAAGCDAAGDVEGHEMIAPDRVQVIRVEEERIEIVAFGEQNPVEPNALPDGSPNEEGRAANRRVEVTIETEAFDADEARAPTLIETITQTDEAGGEESSANGE